MTAQPGRTIILDATIMTMDEDDRYLPTGHLVIEGSRIAAILEDAPVIWDGDTVIDGRGMAALPGLVDLHFHTAIGKGYSDHLPLWEYLDECWYPIIRALDPEAAYWAAMVSYAESIKCGVTTANDMYRQLPSLAQAASDIGMRVVLSNDIALPEYRLDVLDDNRDAFTKLHGMADGRVEVRVGLEWMPLASPELLRDIRGLADELGVGVHMHLSESPTEVEDTLAKYGKRPTQVAYEAGLLGPDVVAAHCVWLDDDDISLIAETGTHVSHNPSSNAKLGNGIARLPEMLAAGINVGLGHDAAECNNSNDMFEVMKFASLMHRGQRADASILQAREVLGMATRNGARALGHDTGRLVVGAKADVILVDMFSPMTTPFVAEDQRQLESHLVFAAHGGAVDTTIIDGRVVMRAHQLVTWDESEIVQQANDAFRRIQGSLEVIRSK